MTATITDVIVQSLPTNNVTAEFPIETAIVNVRNGKCPLLFVNNTLNSIKLHPNQLIAVAKHALRHTETSINCQVPTAAADHDLTDHKPAALDKLLPCHTDQQKLDFALNKMTTKTYVTAPQKSKTIRVLRQNPDIFSLPNAQYTITDEHQATLEGIKKALTSLPFLPYTVYDGKAQFVIQINASTTAIQAIFYQENGNDQWVIAYNSHLLTDAET
uniref:Reverse transcriptase/retrotransposon-derived protein RNase H-like domain-containing protein n=1 Tax=Romanomermis culicivorax TaxID=13658 RepID=A0A915HI17_ROMCU